MRTATTKQQRKQFEERKKKNVVQNYLESVRNVANQETLKRRHCATICTLFCCVHFFVLLSPICIYTALHWIAHILIAWTQNWKHSNAPFLNAPKCRGRDRTEARKSSSELNRLYTCVRIFFLLFFEHMRKDWKCFAAQHCCSRCDLLKAIMFSDFLFIH